MSDDERAKEIYKVMIFWDWSKPAELKEFLDYIQELTGEDRDFIKQVLQTEVDEGRLKYSRTI